MHKWFIALKKKKKKQFIYNNIQIPILYNFTEFGLVSKLTSLGNQSKFIQPFLHIKKKQKVMHAVKHH